MDYTIHGILQARKLEWVAFPFSRGSSQTRDRTQVSHIAGGFFTSWASKNTEVGSLSLLQGIFLTQESNRGLLHCTWILYHLRHQESPRILEWVTYPFTSGSSWPRNWTQVSCIAGRFFTELSGKYLVKCKRFQIQNNVSIFAEWVEVFCLIFIPFLFSLKCFFLFSYLLSFFW